MTWPKRAAFVIAVVGFASLASADQWNDRTILTFNSPVMVPDTTLEPGTYVFKLLDSNADCHVVQIFNRDETRLVVTTEAIPARRTATTSDTVIKLNPTTTGAPVAIKAWFYPGSVYGQEFVYPDKQAREIAQRTKTLVLSADVDKCGMRGATLYVYDGSGRKIPWQRDERMLAEWHRWDTAARRTAALMSVGPVGCDSRPPGAAAVQRQPKGTPVSVDDLENNPSRYLGKTVTVPGEVDAVLGPHLFTINEPDWAEGELLVYLPTDYAAIVRRDDRVTVTGTLRMPAKVDLDREFAWLEPGRLVNRRVKERPLLVAASVVGSDDRALAIKVTRAANGATAVGTSGPSPLRATCAITDASTLANGDRDLVGRLVELERITVRRVATNHGFWVNAGGIGLFVLPAAAAALDAPSVAGQSLSIDGVVLEMPPPMRSKARVAGQVNDEIYVFATVVN